MAPFATGFPQVIDGVGILHELAHETAEPHRISTSVCPSCLPVQFPLFCLVYKAKLRRSERCPANMFVECYHGQVVSAMKNR